VRQPLRIVVDRHLQIPLDARVLEGGHVLIATAEHQAHKALRLHDLGAEVVQLPDAEGKVDLQALLHELGRRELNEVLVESGNRLNGALLKSGVVDELIVYFAPHLLGDSARGMFGLGELTALEQRIQLSICDLRRIGIDLRIIARLGES
jgi:diaminohydroxyphosphoribosylaminopyrimidine deaminase/5-amino-6-(5-phosphoribosylamino)uracil reductase